MSSEQLTTNARQPGKNGRLGSVKKRTACKTCKRRKVRCGEERPSCLRCMRAKLLCAGYDNFVTVGNNDLEVAHIQAPVASSQGSRSQHGAAFVYFRGLGPLSGLSNEDCQAFDFCRHSTLQGLDYLDWSDFWCTTIPAAAHAEPAVLYAMLALGAAHRVFDRCYTIGGDFNHASLSRGDAYTSKAMRRLQRIIQGNNQGAPEFEVILMVCYMLLIFECICGRQDVALLHLQHGRRIIRMIQALRHPDADPSVLYIPDRAETVEHDLIRAFSTMDIQSINWGAPSSEFQLVDDPTSTNPDNISIPSTFQTLSSAGRHLFFLMNEGTKLLAMVKEPDAGARQSRLLGRLATWKASYRSSPISTESGHPSRFRANDKGRFLILQMHHALLVVTTATCLSPDDELIWDSLLPDFRTIAKLAHDLTPIVPPMGLDMAVIQPCLLTAVHCRHPAVRRQALSTLHLVRSKNLWDTTLDIGRIDTVISLEEGAFHAEAANAPLHAAYHLESLIPEHVRIADALAAYTDDTHTELLVSVKRLQPCSHHHHQHCPPDGAALADHSTDTSLTRAYTCQRRWKYYKHRHKVTPGPSATGPPGSGGHENMSITDGLLTRERGVQGQDAEDG